MASCQKEKKKKGICHVLTNLPGRRGYNLGTEEPRKQTYTGEHVNWHIPYGYKRLLPSSGLSLSVSLSPSCKLQALPSHCLLILKPGKVQLKMFCGLSPQRNHVLTFVDNMQVSMLVNLLSVHTQYKATSQSHLYLGGLATLASRDIEVRFTHLCRSVGCHWQTTPWPMRVLQGALPTLGGRELLVTKLDSTV